MWTFHHKIIEGIPRRIWRRMFRTPLLLPGGVPQVPISGAPTFDLDFLRIPVSEFDHIKNGPRYDHKLSEYPLGVPGH